MKDSRATSLRLVERSAFAVKLLEWYDPGSRPLPWKGEKDPYLVWLSEVILQQTRVEQGRAYYLRFVEAFPSITDLAAASEDTVLKLWEGLGYYSRARNMHFTAKWICSELNGEFPATYAEIRKLKGVGPYTAAAIASFAYDLPYAVLDGNVFRILARVFGIDTPIDTTEGKRSFTALAEQLLLRSKPALYNQAIMDFGATVCTPKKPGCSGCTFQDICVANATQQVMALPVKSKKITRKIRYFHFFVMKFGNQVFLQKRTEKDIWQELYQFPLQEVDRLGFNESSIRADGMWEDLDLQNNFSIREYSTVYRQILTHQEIIAVFWKIDLHRPPRLIDSTLLQVQLDQIEEFAFPKLISRYLSVTAL